MNDKNVRIHFWTAKVKTTIRVPFALDYNANDVNTLKKQRKRHKKKAIKLYI